ncbi:MULTISPECIES: hypothetical protein [Microcystis]|uniref:hypothetical protein n=1 Tax=Microcystis TaxID=1125 RepID=UPI0016802ED8|nr:hypothetical protein [Microcystis wesenbergii]MBD2115792.1 hypothetical protein [Microcystis wesenbergii FACHB-1339]
MTEFRAQKVVSSLPVTLQANTLYFVRTGNGFDLYCSDQTGTIAHKLNDGDAPIQRESVLLRGANTGSVAVTLPIFYTENITLLRVVNAQNSLIGSSGSAVINVLFGSGASFTTIPGLGNRTITTTPTSFLVSNNGQLITTTQSIRVEYVSFTSGPVDIALTFEYSRG